MGDKKYLLDIENEKEDPFEPAALFGENYNNSEIQKQNEEPKISSSTTNNTVNETIPETTKIDFEDFHFQENKSNETNIIQQIPLPQTADSFYNNNNNNNPNINFNEKSTINEEVPKKTTHWWNIEHYNYLFNVTTKQVGIRLLFSLIPMPKFFSLIQSNPDFYGPFWIASTLIFILASIGNIETWLKAVETNQQDTWYFDVKKLSIATGVIYGYLAIIPLILYGICNYYSINLKWLDIICIYGYSFFIYLPISILCVLPFTTLQWIFIGIAGILSTSFLLSNFFIPFRTHIGKGIILLIIMGALHIGFAFVCKFYFFA
jgi:hypothetical protein